MKTLIWAIVILAVAAGILMECRYALIVDSPVVARIDRLTGDVWIANSGVWRKIELPAQQEGQQEKIAGPDAAAK